MNDCKIKVFYEQVKDSPLLLFNKKLSTLSNYESFRKLIIKQSNDTKTIKDIKKVAVQEKDKFILEINTPQIAGLNSIFEEETFKYLKNKISEGNISSVRLYIKKVKEYPDWSPPQIYEILKNTLQKASEENAEVLKKELTLPEQEELDNGYRVYFNNKQAKKVISEDVFKSLHAKIFCNICSKGNFFGFRYICAECNNYNLCENCYLNNHDTHNKEHTFIRLKDPIFVDISLYDCLINPKKKIIKNNSYEPFSFEIEIINNGDMNLIGCFLSPIRFGKKYLGCSKDSIDEEILTGNKYKLTTLIKIEDDGKGGFLEQYEGYFRLMTKEGLPFGEILYLQFNKIGE